MASALVLVSVLILAISYLSYKDKLKNIAAEAQQFNTKTTVVNNADQSSTSNQGDEHKEFVDQFNLGENEELKLTYFGSVSLVNETKEDMSWPHLVDEKLFSDTTIEIDSTLISVGRESSIEVIQNEWLEKVIETEPHLLLFEPFLLNNNGVLLIEDSLEALESMLSLIEVSLPDSVVILMPPNPLHSAVNYLAQVEEFQSFAEENNYLYANHWTAWPDSDDDELLKYLDNGRPNQLGHQLWAESIVSYLTENLN